MLTKQSLTPVLAQVAKYAEEQSSIEAEAKALILKSKQKEAANTKLWEEVHQAAQVLASLLIALRATTAGCT